MRSSCILIVLAAGALASTIPSSAARAERICIEPECYTAECWPIPGGRRCRRVCRQRCWNKVPRLPQPEPEYALPAPRYAPPVPEYVPPAPRREEPPRRSPPQYAGPHIDPAAIVIGAIGLIVLIMFLTRGRRLRRELRHAEVDSLTARSLTSRLQSDIRDVDRFINRQLREAYRRGTTSKE